MLNMGMELRPEDNSFITVKDLRTMLLECPQDARVILSSDEEGNSYQALHSIQAVGITRKSSPNYVEVAENAAKVNAVLLWPY